MANENIRDEITKSIDELGQQHIQTLYELTEKHANDLQQLVDIILEDMIDSYDALIQQRQQSIDKYIKVISFLLQDEKDISKPIQSLVEKKMNDIAELKKEIAPIKEFQELMTIVKDNDDYDESLDPQFNDLIQKLKNI